MKTLILSTLIVLFSLVSFADENAVSENKELNTQAFELFGKNIDSLKLEGPGSRDIKLRPIMDDLGNFMSGQLYSFSMMSTDENDYTGGIKTFTANCKESVEQNQLAECKLIIEYKPLGERGFTFLVSLDDNKKPVSIINNLVTMDIGD